MRKLSFTLWVLFCLQSCIDKEINTKPDFNFLKECNEIEVVYYNKNDTITYRTVDTSLVSILTALISGEKDYNFDNCKPSGKLIFLKNSNSIFNAEFSTPNTNPEVECNFVVYSTSGQTFRHKMNYRTGMLLDEFFWKIKSSTLILKLDSNVLTGNSIKKEPLNNR